MDNLNTKPQHENAGSLMPVLPEHAAEKRDALDRLQIDGELEKYLLDNLWKKCEKLYHKEWQRIKQDFVRAEQYFDANQYGFVDDECNWRDYDKRPGEVNYQDNVYQPHVQTILMEISKGRTEFTFSHISDNREGQMIARIAEMRVKTNRQKTFDAYKLQQENLNWVLSGIALRYTYPTWKEGGKIPQFGSRESGGEALKVTVCAVCAQPRSSSSSSDQTATQPAEEYTDTAEVCTGCGAAEVEILESPKTASRVVTGYEQNKTFENKWAVVAADSVLFYLKAACVAETPYIIWKQKVLTEILQSQYPEIKITPVEKDEITVHKIIEDKADAESEFEQGWFDYNLYCNIIPKKELKLKNGMVIPAGKPLGESFPSGLVIAKNGKRILDLWNEDKNEKWSAVPYIAKKGTMVGAGTKIALDNQDIKNDLRNLHMASVMQDAFRKEFVQSRYLEGENVPNSPSERAVVTNLPQGERIVGTVIDALPPSSLSADAYGMEERVDGSIQMQLGTFSGTQAGAPDLKAVQDTAAGMQMWREMTVGRFYPMLSSKADALDREQAYQFLINDQKYLSAEQWAQLAGDYGREAVRAFLKCNLRDELIIEVVPESYMPQSAAQQISNTMGFGRFIAENQIPLDSELAAEGARMFKIPKTVIGFDAQYSAAYASIELFKVEAQAIIEAFGDVPDFNLENPMVFQLAELVVSTANKPINRVMDDHAAMINAYKDWWNKDEGRAASNLLKAAVILRVEQHREATAELEASNQVLMMKAKAPQMQMEQQMAEQQMAGAAEQEQLAAEQQAGQMQAEQEAAGMQSAVESLHRVAELEEADKQRAHERELAEMDAQTQKETARAKKSD